MHPIASLFGEDDPRTTPQFSSSVAIGLPALTEFVTTRGRLCEEARFVINVTHSICYSTKSYSRKSQCVSCTLASCSPLFENYLQLAVVSFAAYLTPLQ